LRRIDAESARGLEPVVILTLPEELDVLVPDAIITFPVMDENELPVEILTAPEADSEIEEVPMVNSDPPTRLTAPPLLLDGVIVEMDMDPVVLPAPP
jgi:hypothetical protein